MLSRRDFIRGTIGACGATAPRLVHAKLGTAAPGADGFITLRAATAEAPPFAAGAPPGPALSFGSVPGPIIRVGRGEEIKVRLINALDEPTVIHWHGLRLPNAMDGAPPLTPVVAPGASFDYRFIAPDAGTFWYHAAAEPQRLRGLFGALVVDEQTPPPGVDRDEVLVIADAAAAFVAPKDFGGAGGGEVRGHGLAGTEDAAAVGVGNWLFTINGAPSVDIMARQNERVRLRFINASARAIMSVRIEALRLWVIMLDGQPAEPFVPREGLIVLGPGNRADIFLDAIAAPGSVEPVRLAQVDPQTGRETGSEATLLRLVYQNFPLRPSPLAEPGPLPGGGLPGRMDFARALRATLALGATDPTPRKAVAKSEANGRSPPLFIATRGRTVMLAIENRGNAKAVHLHGHSLRLLDRLDDGWKPYWLDTVLVPERQTLRLAFVADNPGRWAIEALSLDGSAAANTWFQVS
jgi:FtsP/CotA-like multicopper oxidase with cupredoxin domain